MPTDTILKYVKYRSATDFSEKFTTFAAEYFVRNANYDGCVRNDIRLPAETKYLPQLHIIYDKTIGAGRSDKLYYFNANHLGSGSLITDGNGQTYQTLAYTPYGVDLVNIRHYQENYDEVRHFGGHRIDETTGLLDMGARDLDPILSIEYTTDPMWYKFPSLSPYNAMGNNPIMFIDPDGKEKINAFQKEDKLHTAAEKAKDNDNTIYVFAHGNGGGVYPHIASKDKNTMQKYDDSDPINSPKDLDIFLSKHSTIWQNRKEEDNILIVLVSCNVGYGNLAKQISEAPTFQNHTIVAPDNFVWGFSNNGNFVVAPKATNYDGSFRTNAEGNYMRDTKEFGNWNYYNNGILVQTRKGDDLNKIVIPYRPSNTEIEEQY